jgi:hypothetical protein
MSDAVDNESSQSPALIPIEQKEVDFYGDSITTALVEYKNQTQVYVPIRPICNYLGVDARAQLRRVQRDPVLSKKIQGVAMIAIPSGEKRSAGGVQNTWALPIEMLPGWLFGIDSNRVKPEMREKVLRYQEECFQVLWRAFQDEATRFATSGHSATATDNSGSIATDIDLTLLTEEDYVQAEAEIIRRMNEVPLSSAELTLMQMRITHLSMARLAEQQLEIGLETKRAHSRLDAASLFVANLQRRLGASISRTSANEIRLNEMDARLERIEERLSPPQNFITEDQAVVIAMEVKALAELLTTREANESSQATSGRNAKRKPQNQYANIFAELYRRYSVSSYRSVRLSQYPAVLQFLADWKKASDDGLNNDVFLQGRLF